jgi:hypothetical protein
MMRKVVLFFYKDASISTNSERGETSTVSIAPASTALEISGLIGSFATVFTPYSLAIASILLLP